MGMSPSGDGERDSRVQRDRGGASRSAWATCSCGRSGERERGDEAVDVDVEGVPELPPPSESSWFESETLDDEVDSDHESEVIDMVEDDEDDEGEGDEGEDDGEGDDEEEGRGRGWNV